MLCELVLYLIGLVLVLGAGLVIYARWNFGELEKLGIPVVKPHWLLGSTWNFYKIQNHHQDLQWFKEHGDIYGVYEGRTPQIHINDPDIIKQIFIKHSDSFHDRNGFDIGNNSVLQELMDNLTGEKWKVVRSCMSPSFTTAKLKKMSHIMKDVSEEFAANMKKEVQSSKGLLENVNLTENLYCSLTDMVARCTLNVKIANPRDPENEFAKGLKDLFSSIFVTSAFLPLQYAFPIIKKLLLSMKKDSSIFFGKVFTSVMDGRRKSGTKQNDFIDFLLENCERTKTEEFKRLGITEKTLLAQGVEFFIAGQDSMAATLSVLAHYLSLPQNAAIEKKLYAEVDAYVEKHDGKVSHETFGELVYLNACLNEVLRLHPLFTKIDRLCNRDWEYKGLRIKKGTVVVLPLWSYNRNPKYWEDPETFNPERFMPYNKDKFDPIAFGSFGSGPRVCPGKMFAFECMTVLSVHLLSAFKFSIKPGAAIQWIPGTVQFSFMFPILLDVAERKKTN